MESSTAQVTGEPTSPRRSSRPAAARSVSAIGIGATRRCRRSACGEPATATLVFSYDDQVARLVELLDEREPQTYDLCRRHADRTSPPVGWELADTRPPTTDTPRRLEDDDTVAVIAAALRGDDTPRRVDVIAGGDDPAPPRRVTVTTPVADEPVRTGATTRDEPDALADDGEDPLRAALEELQRVVEPSVDDEADSPVPLVRTRDPRLPAPPATPPPLVPPAMPPPDPDRPTLW